MWRFAPSAIHSTLASRRLLQLVDVLISSIVSTASMLSNYKREFKGLSFCSSAPLLNSSEISKVHVHRKVNDEIFRNWRTGSDRRHYDAEW